MIRPAALALLVLGGLSWADSPEEFGRAELNQALAARKINPARFKVQAELSAYLPLESFQILAGLVRGGSPRAIMYGLIEASEQVKARGRLTAVKVSPKVELRGVRRVATATAWSRSKQEWLDLFSDLARKRMNRFHLIVEGDLNATRLAALERISEAASLRAIDLVVSLQNPEAADVSTLLASCSAVRAVHVDPLNAAYVSGPVAQAGRYVVLESSQPVDTAVPVPLRIGVTPESPIRSCKGRCGVYLVFSSQDQVPAKLDGVDGVELQGEPSDEWVNVLYPVSRPAPAPARKKSSSKSSTRRRK